MEKMDSLVYINIEMLMGLCSRAVEIATINLFRQNSDICLYTVLFNG
jgi:hypothetical protein